MGIFDIENEITREILKDRGYRVVYNINEEHQRKGKNYFINIHRVYKYNSEVGSGEFYWYAYVLDGGYDRWKNKVIYSGKIELVSDLIALEDYD
jgi:hypothetical protein